MADAAERVLEDATDDEKTVYRLRYVDGMNSRMASDTMYVSEATYYRILRGLIDKVEKELA
jgi:DNA-directed RNA polymerase specialized sigma subunit